MIHPTNRPTCLPLMASLLMLLVSLPAWGDGVSLLDATKPDLGVSIDPQGGSAEVVKTEGQRALSVSLSPAGGDWPAVHLVPKDGQWDLSQYSGIEIDLENVGQSAARIHGRIDNPGDWQKSPWSINATKVAAGETGTIRVVFGQSYGNPGYDLDPSKITRIVIFAEKPKGDVDLHVTAIRAMGDASGADTQAGAAVVKLSNNGGRAGTLLDMSSGAALSQLSPSSTQVTYERSRDLQSPGIVVNVEAGNDGYPGVTIKPEGSAWDLSEFGHVEATITNTSDQSLHLSLRADDSGDWKNNPWNAEARSIKPGETQTIKVIFGYSYGYKKSHALKSDAVVKLLIFGGKAKKPYSFRIDEITAAGATGETPPVNPNSIRVEPVDGYLLGGKAVFDVQKQAKADGAQVAADGKGLIATLASGGGTHNVVLRPEQGRWDLRQFLEVVVEVENAGDGALTPRVRLESNGSPSAWVKTDAPLAPGATASLAIPFAIGASWIGPADATQKYANGENVGKFSSDAVAGVTITADGGSGDRVLRVRSVQANVPTPDMPDWLGKRPPAEGDWVATLDENFDSNVLDDSVWNITGENYWDKKSHFSKDNTILGDGVVRLRFSKQRGHQNDDPNHERVTDYATGYLDTYGKWTQTYGYFEARMKLPQAPGLWPAFWTMPDRGNEDDPRWKRQDTANGGMEFDIMEHLTRWGPYRMHGAFHWDGYQKNHKSTGLTNLYVNNDEEGYITCGLLWLPGEARYYVNGQETGRWENDRVASVPMILMFTLPCGGWDNSPLDDAQLPSDFIVDYVRCWQRRDLMTP